jgi:hypothetical protein
MSLCKKMVLKRLFDHLNSKNLNFAPFISPKWKKTLIKTVYFNKMVSK